MVLMSRKVDYAIVLLCHLMRCQTGASARELAASYGLSRPFIANILKELCQEGLVESHRGVRGGYRLATDPKAVTLRRLIDVLDGHCQLVSCSDGSDAEACGLMPKCPVRDPLHRVHRRLMGLLDTVTLADLRSDADQFVALQPGKRRNARTANLSR